MQKKVALVTGGMGGIGTAICQELCTKGARVLASYNRKGNHQQALAWQQQQSEKGYEIGIGYVDVSNFKSCEKLIQEGEKQCGPVDILVNNAGITEDVQCHKMHPELWEKVINTNLNSVFYVTRNVINGMMKRGYGRIINISSINGQKGQRGQVNYAAAKAGMHGFTKALALEVARNGITVNTVSPGYIATDMVMAIPEEIRDKIVTQIPVGRLGEPTEIARVVSFLASEASGFITGTNIAVNGGHYMS